MAKANRLKAAVSVITICAMTLVMPGESQAGLKEAMNDMFVTTSTSAQTYNSQRLMGVYGGSLSFRSPGRGINIVQFAPPRIDAGCGGIDIFFGSFSFINGAQFEQLLRSIAANATGFAVKAAIKLMCNPCDEILSRLQQAMETLNSMAKNTCAIANSMVAGSVEPKLKEQAARVGTALSGALSLTADWLSGESKRQSQTPSDAATAGGNAQARENNPNIGNFVWRAANETMGKGANTLQVFMNKRQAIEIIMGLFGTTVNRSADAGESCGAGVNPEGCDQPVQTYPSKIANWDQLLKASRFSPGGVGIYSCLNEDAECTKIDSSRKLPISEWGGVEDIVNQALFGTTKPEVRSSWTDNSIVGSFANKRPLTAGSLDARSQAILDLTPFPLLHFLLEAQKIPGAPEQIGMIVAQFLPDYFGYMLGIELLTIGKSAFTEQTKAMMPEGYAAELKLKEDALMRMRPDAERMNSMVKAVYDSLVINQRLTTSQMRGSSGSSDKR